MPDAFYIPDGDHLVATLCTRGPWHPDHQHGGPPAALLTGAMVRAAPDFALARVTVELLRPVPIGPLRIDLQVQRAGRRVQRLRATLTVDDRVLAQAQGLFIRRTELALDAPSRPPAWPDPDSLPPYTFTFFEQEVGYHTAVELRLAHGQWGSTPIGFWGRPRVPLVAGEQTLPEEAVVVLADAQSGMGVPLDPRRYTFLNPDLTVYFERPPAKGWTGFDVRSGAGPMGTGLSESALRDRQGLLGRSAQALVVAERQAGPAALTPRSTPT